MKLWTWMRRILGIRDDTFVTVQQARYAGSGIGKVGEGMDSNVVMAPVQWIQRTFTQAEPVVERREGEAWVRSDMHAAASLLSTPNEFYDGDALQKAALLSYFLDGNAYLIKVRSTLRRVVELWYAPHWLIEPKWPEDGSEFISHYEYRPQGIAENLDPRDVVHLRFGLDPRNPRLGLSPVKTALKEVLTDEEASGFSAYILKNMGVPGGVISPKDNQVLPSPEDVEAMKDHMSNKFSGKNRGEWLVVGAPTNIEQFGFDPGRLMLGPLRDISEERICAVLGVPAAVVGFGAGLQSTKVGATMRELVRLARVNCIEPTQTSIGRQLSRQLMPDFEPEPESTRIVFDNRNVSMFQEDLSDVAKRAALLFEKGLVDRDEGREMVNLPPGEEESEPPEPPTPPGNQGNGAGGRLGKLDPATGATT